MLPIEMIVLDRKLRNIEHPFNTGNIPDLRRMGIHRVNARAKPPAAIFKGKGLI